jgi:hypothetical protein
MTIKARTTRTENDLVTCANANNIPLSSLDHTVNSSGMFTVFHKEALVDSGTLIFGTDDTTGTAPGAAYGTALTTAVNVANAGTVALFVTVVGGNATTLTIFPRLSRLGEPVPATEANWYRPVDTTGAFSSVPILAIPMTTPGTKFVVEVDVGTANWVTFSFAGNASHEITIYAEPVA